MYIKHSLHFSGKLLQNLPRRIRNYGAGAEDEGLHLCKPVEPIPARSLLLAYSPLTEVEVLYRANACKINGLALAGNVVGLVVSFLDFPAEPIWEIIKNAMS